MHSDEEMLKNLHFVKEIGLRSLEALEQGYLNEFGRLMDEHWQHKKRRSGAMSNPKIDEWYELGIANGATKPILPVLDAAPAAMPER